MCSADRFIEELRLLDFIGYCTHFVLSLESRYRPGPAYQLHTKLEQSMLHTLMYNMHSDDVLR